MRRFISAALAVFISGSLFALEVNRSELQSVKSADEIVFRNYSGPHSVINTAEQIREIGAALGRNVAKNPENFLTEGNKDRYSVIHAIDTTTKENLDADIFIIGANATVDHITNVRRIISAYLMEAYGYSRQDADTIATFVTVYNAVYRGNIGAFEQKYKKIVLDNISADKVGISTNYEEWPGRTQIVIPLSDIAGGLSTIDTSIISDKQVVKSMQNEDDKGVDSRKAMVDIKEREAENATNQAQEAQKKSVEENARAKEELANAESAKKEAGEAQKEANDSKLIAENKQAEADAAKQNAEDNPNDAAAQKAADDAQKEADEALKAAEDAQKVADEKKVEAEEAQKEAEEAQKNADEAAEIAAEKQAEADKKRSEAQAERKEIAQDQQILVKDAIINTPENFVYGLKNLDEQGFMSTIVILNWQTGKLVKESPVSVIRSRTVFEDGDYFIAIAGNNSGNGAVRLVQIDKVNLEIEKESSEIVSDYSVLIQKDGFYYCVINQGGNCYLAKISNSLEVQMKSDVTVHPATPITITPKGILATDAASTPIVLNLENLTKLQ